MKSEDCPYLVVFSTRNMLMGTRIERESSWMARAETSIKERVSLMWESCPGVENEYKVTTTIELS